MTAQLSRELLAKIERKIAACKTAEEAKALYLKTPPDDNNVAHLMAYRRWAELADSEIEANLENCNTVEEAEALYKGAPQIGRARDCYEERWMELLFGD